MGANSKQAEELIRKLRELNRAPMTVEPAVVKSVDLDNLTCVVELLNETEIPDVRLKAAVDEIPGVTTKDGLVQIPVVESTVLVAMIGNESATRFVLAFSDVDEVVMFSGAFGGLIKVTSLVTKLNNLENKVNALITWGLTVSPPFAPGTLLTATVRADIENTKVKH